MVARKPQKGGKRVKSSAAFLGVFACNHHRGMV